MLNAMIDMWPLFLVLLTLGAACGAIFLVFGAAVSAVVHIKRPPSYVFALFALLCLGGAAEAAQISLEWDPYVNQPGNLTATHINVYRRLNTPPGPYTAMPFGQVLVTVNTWDDTSVENGKGYCYQITAYNPDIPFAESARSNEVCGLVPSLNPPATPVNLRVRSITP